jgi:hypothetical protein
MRSCLVFLLLLAPGCLPPPCQSDVDEHTDAGLPDGGTGDGGVLSDQDCVRICGSTDRAGLHLVGCFVDQQTKQIDCEFNVNAGQCRKTD